jgi:hypothetical protein
MQDALQGACCLDLTSSADSVLASAQAQHCQYVGTWHEGNFIEGKWVYNDGSMFSGSLGEVTAQAANAEQVGGGRGLCVLGVLRAVLWQVLWCYKLWQPVTPSVMHSGRSFAPPALPVVPALTHTCCARCLQALLNQNLVAQSLLAPQLAAAQQQQQQAQAQAQAQAQQQPMYVLQNADGQYYFEITAAQLASLSGVAGVTASGAIQ